MMSAGAACSNVTIFDMIAVMMMHKFAASCSANVGLIVQFKFRQVRHFGFSLFLQILLARVAVLPRDSFRPILPGSVKWKNFGRWRRMLVNGR